jgi:hypothetical protein
MKGKYLFLNFFLVALISLVSIRLETNVSKVESSFSPVAANPTNLIDISKLTSEDYRYISEENSSVFVSKKDSQIQVYFDDKQLQSLEMSPSGKQVVFSYDPNETDELKESELSLMTFDLTNKSVKEVFHTVHPSWDVRSDLHWLGNDHIIFLRNCGTSCQGLTMLNIQTGKTKNATLSYMLSPDQQAYTHFEDWFDNHHELNNFVEKMYTEAKDGKYYMLFNMKTDIGEESSQERFLFTGSDLVLES